MAGENGYANGVHAPHVSEELPDGLSMIDRLAGEANEKITGLKNLFAAIAAPLPTQTGDGSSLPLPEKRGLVKDIQSLAYDVASLGHKKIEDLADVAMKMKTKTPLDDKLYYMERLIQIVSPMAPDGLSKSITENFLTTLYSDLEHPPQNMMSDEFMYRQPDGSHNSLQYPHVGAAGMPYARTVTTQTRKDGTLPDPAVLFDTLLARENPEGTEHPNKISSILFYLASIIIHDCFKTNRDDPRISDTSSYLDLAPLYGSNWEEQKKMRTMKDGKLKPDCFSETRLLTFPPGVGAILIMFNRYHNYIAEQLGSINEDERFAENKRQPEIERYGERINKREDDIFQTARLVTCSLYVNIILIDYVRTILNLNQTDDNWQLNPRADIPDGPPRGTGNQVSAEFNLVYRWHAAISTRDDKWTQEVFKEVISDKTGVKPEDAGKPENIPKFLRALGEQEAAMLAMDPQDRPFPALAAERAEMKRTTEGPRKGYFKDEDLAKILTDSIEDCANAFGPRQIPIVMKAVEILGIKQARTWKLGTLNEFRRHFGLKEHCLFSDITENKEVQDLLKHLYDTPDHVELYPGLVVEDAKRPMIGSGLCPSYTVSRGILSDATALVRGDRFYTTAYSPASLTNWGFEEASSDVKIDNGCVFYKLFLRALPNSFDPTSVYVHYPMTVPHGPRGMEAILRSLNKAEHYNFDHPSTHKEPEVIFSWKTAKAVLEDSDNFKVTWGGAIQFLMGPASKNFMLAGDGPENYKSRKLMEHALYDGDSSRAIPRGTEKWFEAVRDFYEQTTTRLLKEKSFALGGMKQVDIIRDVGNLVSVHFASELFGLPLKTEKFDKGVYTETQLYMVAAAVFTCVFFDLDPPKSFPLRQIAHEITQQLGSIVEMIVGTVKKTSKLPITGEAIIDAAMPPSTPLRDYGVHLIARMLKQNDNVPDLVFGNMMGTFAGMIANQGQVFAQAMDYLLTTDQGRHLPELNRLAKEDTPEADDKILHYMMEATRLGAETGVMRYVANDITIIDDTKYLGKRELKLKKGDKVLVNLCSAAKDPITFPDPDIIKLDRPLDSYISLGFGLHQCIGLPMTYASLPTMLKVVAKLDGLRPADVGIGATTQKSRVKRVVKEFFPGSMQVMPESWHYHVFLTEQWERFFPFPTNLKVNWDSDTLNEPSATTNGTNGH